MNKLGDAEDASKDTFDDYVLENEQDVEVVFKEEFQMLLLSLSWLLWWW